LGIDQGQLAVTSHTSTEEDDDFDEIEEIENGYEEVDDATAVMDGCDARRRLEKVLEDKALERLINGDFYDY
jgi:hypothetical protein